MGASAQPLVSIVLPTRNGARFLRQALDSCLNQTYRHLELIVLDDGSTDETPDILGEYQDPRLRVIRHAQGWGLPESLNDGFAHAQGEYFTWTSDDNLYEPNAIQEMLSHLEQHPDVAFVYASFWRIDDNGVRVEDVPADGPENIVDYNCVGACFLYRRSVYETIGKYNAAERLVEDYEFWLRTSMRFKMAPIQKYLYSYRVHAGSLTGKMGLFKQNRLVEAMKLRLGCIDRKRYRARLAWVDMCEAFDAFQRGDSRAVLASGLRGIVRDPSYLKNRGVLSILLRSAIGKRPAGVVRGMAAALVGSARG